MNGLPDPSGAHALVIGTSAYADDNYPDMPAVTASAGQIDALLRAGRIWGMPEENVHYLSDVTLREAAETIDAVARSNGLGALLVYICGHGRVWDADAVPDGQGHLALADSRHPWEFTHLPLRAVARMLGGASRADRMLIIDAPHSADVRLGGHPGGPGPSRLPGTCTLTARHWAAADSTWPGTDFTPFSGALIDVLERGVRGPEKFLTPESLFRELWWRLSEAGHPEPAIQSSGAQLLLGRNPGYDPAATRPAYAHLLQTLDAQRAPGPLGADPAAYAHAVADCRAAGHDPAAVELIGKLGAVGLVSDVAEFAGQLYCAGLAGDADHVVSAFASCRPESEIAQLAHRMHRQAEVSVDGLLRVLAQRETSVLAGLVAALRARSCAECAATADAISERILSVWPRERHGELLVAWP
jgi:hypothetical protein